MRRLTAVLLSVAAIAAAVSCQKNLGTEQDSQAPQTNTPETIDYSISFDATQVKTKVVYSDGISDPTFAGDGTFTMDWKEGDEVVAIRWPRTLNTAPTDWFTLKAVKDEDSAKILFTCNRASFPANNPLQQGERFVLIHGDFILGDSEDKASLSFPIARVKLPSSTIHHGGRLTKDKTQILFDSQDGSLESLSKHQFMVADAYANIISDDADYSNPDVKGLVQLTKEPVAEGTVSTDPIKLSSVSTVIRVQAFLPDAYFTGDREGETIQAMSISAYDKSKVFYRYFRMHPNQEDESTENKNYWLTDANFASECNPYLRINLSEGFNPLVENEAQNKLISRQYTNASGIQGHLVTAYFAIPSKNLTARRAEIEKELKVCVFTNTHAYKTKKTYTISSEALRPGNVIPMTINLKPENADDIDADTDGQLGVTFAPGFVYADKQEDGSWNYGIYEHQGQYAGMSQQTLDFGEYFVFGSADPTETYHLAMEDGTEVEKFSANYYRDDEHKQDVSELVFIKGVNPFTMPTRDEAERIFENVMDEEKYCIGYYYYPVSGTDDRTYHLSANAQKAMAAAGVPNDGQIYAGSYGIWVGTKTQPAYDKQDRYLFIPDSKQLDMKKTYRTTGFEKRDGDGNLYPGGYTFADRGYLYIPGSGWEAEENVLKFSMNTCDESDRNGFCYRLQFWYRKGTGTGYFDTSTTNVKEMEVQFGRPVRGVIF